MTRRLTQALAALALALTALALTGTAAEAARPCPPGMVKKVYGYGCTPSPSTPPPTTAPPTTAPPTTAPPTSAPPTTHPPTTAPARTTAPPLPVTGAAAGPIAWAGGALVLLGALFAIWATLFVRRHRFQA